jgi:5'-phosphate synthase pdxT subunit
MAKTVEHPRQESFGWIPVGIRRNAYGRQNESFIVTETFTLPDGAAYAQECVFIRAPMVTMWDEAVTVLGSHGSHPIALVHDRHLLTTFHPELSPQTALHELFVSLCRGAASGKAAAQG